jgi:hypothetical protein
MKTKEIEQELFLNKIKDNFTKALESLKISSKMKEVLITIMIGSVRLALEGMDTDRENV